MGNNFLNSLGLNNIETNQIDTVEEQPINTTNTSLEVNQEFDELFGSNDEEVTPLIKPEPSEESIDNKPDINHDLLADLEADFGGDDLLADLEADFGGNDLLADLEADFGGNDLLADLEADFGGNEKKLSFEEQMLADLEIEAQMELKGDEEFKEISLSEIIFDKYNSI